MTTTVTVFRDSATIPAAFEPAFAVARSGDVARSRAWLEALDRFGIEAGSKFRAYGLESEGAVLGLLPALASRLYRAHPKARVLHFTQVDGEPYAPLAPPGVIDFPRIVEGMLEAVGREARPYDVIRVSPLDPGGPFMRELLRGLARRGYPFQRYRHPEDRYDVTDGISADAFLASRPPALRELWNSIGRPFFEIGRAGFRLFMEPAELDAALEAYDCVMDRIGEEAENEPERQVAAMMRVAAAEGAMRVGVIDFDGEPAAVQFWLLANGVARCLRMWSDPAHSRLPLDDMLLVKMLPRLIDEDRIAELRLGPVEPRLAEHWAPLSRPRSGVIAFNPQTRRGMREMVRHVLLPKFLGLPRRAWRRLRGRA